MDKQKVIISANLENALAEAVSECSPDRLFVLMDETTERLCLPVVSQFKCMENARPIVIKAGDQHKELDAVVHVWNELQHLGATRHSLLVNLGGGMVTDLGGFAASTFKRGIQLINIPTTLLSMVDASVGGKTGFNFGGLKNEIGVFRNASSVILDTIFLQTMDQENLLSGYAEMLKHGLISNEQTLTELLMFDIEQPNLQQLQQMVAESVQVKQRIVQEDPTEQGIRKALNLGHGVRTLSEHRKNRVPRRPYAPNGAVHLRALRSDGYHLRRLPHSARTDDARQEEHCGANQFHAIRRCRRHPHQPDRYKERNRRSTRLLQRRTIAYTHPIADKLSSLDTIEHYGARCIL